MKNIVVTGADGFIGSHLVKRLSSAGYSVTGIVIPNSPTRGRIENTPNVTIVEGNMSEWRDMVERMPQNPLAFFHLAWAGVSPDSRNSISIQLPNIELCLNAVRLAHKIGAERFVLPGSTSEYTECGQLINERALPSAQNAYGATKISVRYLCKALCDELKIQYVYAVITGIYSEDRIDNNVIYYTISSLLDGKRPAFTKLEQLWDYVHIDDVMNAFVLIAEKGKPNAFYTIGHGDNWPLSKYIYQIRDAINPDLELGIGEIPYKDNKMPSSCVDLTALREDTGFEPQISFEVGIARVISRVKEAKKQSGGH